MLQYLDWISLIPLIFLIPPLPYVRKLFAGVDIEKFSYGAATSGILLTFYGIWIGLIGFDVSNIESSIPSLLSGLKVAFGSSIVGLGTSMLINLAFLSSKDESEESLEKVSKSLEELNKALNEFAHKSATMQTESLVAAMKRLVDDLEMGINTETKEVMSKFRGSVEFMSEWQQKHVEEIKSVSEVLGRNAEVTKTTSEQLDKTNQTLDRLGPTTDRVADAIGWIQTALPATRPRNILNKKTKD